MLDGNGRLWYSTITCEQGLFCRAHFTVYVPVPLIHLEHREANGRPHRVAFIARFFVQ